MGVNFLRKIILMNIDAKKISTSNMEHLGIVAGTIKEINLIPRIDALLGGKEKNQLVSMSERIVAMIINGLGFSSRTLSMTAHFFSTKPVEELIGPGVKAEYLNDDALGRALDCIAEFGVTKFFSNLAIDIGLEHNFIGKSAKLDSTTFSFNGEYNGIDVGEENLQSIKLTYGHSKDLRPDLKQATLSIATTGDGSYPFWCEPQDGNSSDKSSFQKTIETYNEFKKQIKLAPDFTWVADSALYNADKLLVPEQKFLWITRVPETINEAKELVSLKQSELKLAEIGNGYSMYPVSSKYGGIEQRWLLIFSEKAAVSEIETFKRKLEAKMEECKKEFWHLSKKLFNCEEDAIKSAEELIKKLTYFTATYKTKPLEKNPTKGRPKKDVEKKVLGYNIFVEIEKNSIEIDKKIATKGRFILATNQLDKKILSDLEIFNEYKTLQNTERGFRFLKDPWFLTTQFFLKTPDRIAALMSIMSLSLLVYTVAESKIRNKLKEQNETIPNQNKKPIQNPTLRWIFQLFMCVTKINLQQDEKFKYVIVQLNEVQKKIITLFGGEIEKFYLSTS